MSIWSHITGVIRLDGSTTEDALLSNYGLYSHNLVGSEGGLHISFTKTEKKNFWSSSESEYTVDRILRINNMVISGDLRDFDEEKLENACEALKEFLQRLSKQFIIEQASFILECDMSDYYYHIAYVKNRVRTKKVKIK